MFVAKGIHVYSPEVMDALIDASLSMLLLQAKVSELESQCQTLELDNRQLAEENMKLEGRVEDLEEEVKRHVRRVTFSQTVPIPTHTNGASTQPSSNGVSKPFSATRGHLNDQPVASSSKTPIFSDPSLEDDESFAARIQLEWQEQVEPGITLARQRQREYEEEDKRLRAQYESLKQEQPATYQCGICLEEEAEFSVAKIESCRHSFCRGCVLSYLRSKLAEHRFPIPCPICAMDRSEQEPGTIDVFLAQNIGLTEEEFTTFSELELAAFSVPLQCHRAGNTAQVPIIVPYRTYSKLTLQQAVAHLLPR
ncbi:hypothetical protein EIP86_011389 [Pleurotus ostreatoroseus]|nr:hypothetical protein EIP86_011389 [Pleurotus ostreatoroseus]